MDKFLNWYTKYPWVAIVIVFQWLATPLTVLYHPGVDIPKVLAATFVSTIIFAYIGFKIPKD